MSADLIRSPTAILGSFEFTSSAGQSSDWEVVACLHHLLLLTFKKSSKFSGVQDAFYLAGFVRNIKVK
jgi:hypothetical protein